MAAFGATMIRAGRRFLSSLPALFGVLVFTFVLMRMLPGDPAVFFASGPNAGKEEIEVIRKQMGLNKPVPAWNGPFLGRYGRRYGLQACQQVRCSVWACFIPALLTVSIDKGLIYRPWVRLPRCRCQSGRLLPRCRR